jgi:hypothetical protein
MDTKKKKKKRLCRMMCAHVRINVHILLSSEKENAIGYGMGIYTCKTGKPTNDWNRCAHVPTTTQTRIRRWEKPFGVWLRVFLK